MEKYIHILYGVEVMGPSTSKFMTDNLQFTVFLAKKCVKIVPRVAIQYDIIFSRGRVNVCFIK